jgi:hypothetical protein
VNDVASRDRITIRLAAARFAKRVQSALAAASAADWLLAKAFPAVSIEVRNVARRCSPPSADGGPGYSQNCH